MDELENIKNQMHDQYYLDADRTRYLVARLEAAEEFIASLDDPSVEGNCWTEETRKAWELAKAEKP